MIRPLTPADAAAYRAIRHTMLLDTPPAFGSSPETDRFREPDTLEKALTLDGFTIVGGFDETGSLVSVAGMRREDQVKRLHIATIWGVFTLPAARRRGLSREVIARAVAIARAWPGLEVLELSVRDGSPARALYESLGFRAWGVEPDALRVGGVSYAEVHMQMVL